MIRSFLNIFLPDDEYKRSRLIYFLAEAAVLVAAILFIFSFLSNWLDWEIDSSFFALMLWGFVTGYTFLRYILSGIEYTDVGSQKQYTKQKRKNLKHAISTGFFFLVGLGIFLGIPSTLEETLDIIGPTVFFVLFSYFGQHISLKRSFNKNKELLDD